jgi:hypothetical protein
MKPVSSDLGPLAAVDIGCEVEELEVLSSTSRIEQFLHHYECTFCVTPAALHRRCLTQTRPALQATWTLDLCVPYKFADLRLI